MSKKNAKAFLIKYDECASLYDAVRNSYVEEEADFSSLFESGFHSRRGVFFRNNRDLLDAQKRFAVQMVKFFSESNLGVKESMAVPLDAFAKCVEESEISKLAFERFLDSHIDSILSDLYNIIVRTNLFSLEDGVEGLRSDKVSVLRAEKAVGNVPFPLEAKSWKISACNAVSADVSDIVIADGVFCLNVSGICWYIHSKFTKENLLEESKWLANIFVSFYRLFIAREQKAFFPGIGQVEAEPFFAAKGHYSGVGFTERRWTSLGIKNQLPYQVSQECYDMFLEARTQNKIDSIFSCEMNSIGHRVRDGLCWLSRARQSSDFSERLLYNFTAIEAILMSSSNKGAPVVETICRFCSIICAKNVKHRKEIYKEIKKLYAIRSELVHKGKRGANLLDSNALQSIAELTFIIVLKECDLKVKHDDFISSLSDASHGTEWFAVN